MTIMSKAKSAATELRTRAFEALKFNQGDISVAAVKLTSALMKRTDLVGAMTLQYLQALVSEPKAAPATSEKPRPKDVNVRHHLRHRRRTEAERDAALRVADAEVHALRTVFDHRINGRPIGDINWGELEAIVIHNAENAASYLHLGTEATANAILAKKVREFAQVQDHSTKVRDVLSSEHLQGLIKEAFYEAPKRIERGMRDFARSIAESDMKEIVMQ